MFAETIHLLAIAGLTWLLLVYLGLPWRALHNYDGADTLGARSALLGLGILTGASWSWLEVSQRGLHGFLLALVVANIAPFAWAARRARKDRGRAVLIGLLEAVAVALAGTAVFTRYFADAFRHHALAASLGNNDLPLYALVSRQAFSSGFGSAGPIHGVDLGRYLRNDYTGAFTVPASVQALFGIRPERSLMAISLLAMLLIAAMLANLCRTLGLPARWLPSALGVLAVSSSTFFYVEGEGFFAQLLAMALFTGLADLLVRVWGAHQGIVDRAGSLEGALLIVALLCVYPHMALLGPPVLVGVGLFAGWLRHELFSRKTLGGLGTLIAAGLLAAILVPTRVVVAWNRTFESASLVAGWTLPRVQLAQVLGIKRYPEAAAQPPHAPNHAAALAAISWRYVFIVILIGGLIALALRAHAAHADTPASSTLSWAFALVTVPLASYYVFYGYFGSGYQQWKWLLFLQPVVLLALTIFAVTVTSESQALPAGLQSVGFLVFVGALLELQLSLTPYPHAEQLRSGLGNLRTQADRISRAGINIEADTSTPYWDAMWLAYYFSDRPVRIVTASYFPNAAPDPRYPTVRLTPQGGSVVVPTG